MSTYYRDGRVCYRVTFRPLIDICDELDNFYV